GHDEKQDKGEKRYAKQHRHHQQEAPDEVARHASSLSAADRRHPAGGAGAHRQRRPSATWPRRPAPTSTAGRHSPGPGATRPARRRSRRPQRTASVGDLAPPAGPDINGRPVLPGAKRYSAKQTPVILSALKMRYSWYPRTSGRVTTHVWP